MSGNRLFIGRKFHLITVMCVIALVVLTASSATAKKKPGIWGVPLPEGAEKIQQYRETATYRVLLEPEEVVRQIADVLGDPKNRKIYRSRIGSTVLVFIENNAPKKWSAIQVSGVVGQQGTYIIITKVRGEGGWRWKKAGRRWEYQ